MTRARKKKNKRWYSGWATGRRRDRCGVCGGCEFIPAIDNHGSHYMGCATCRIVAP